MKKFNNFFLASMLLLGTMAVNGQQYQLPDPGFEDWSGAKFDNKEQLANWHASNVEQSAIGLTFRFNFISKESGHTGVCAMVQDKEVGAAGITEIGPGYFGLGTAWQWLDGLDTKTATAGMTGGISFNHRPDTLSVWIKRTGANATREDFHLLYYAWSGTAKGNEYKSKGGGCSSTSRIDDESDIRQALDANECGTAQKATQVAEGWWREKKEYGAWTNIRVPIYYMNNDVPEKVNVLFSAGNYPNFRANSGLYEGNSLFVDDAELIYSADIDEIYIGDKLWKGFDPSTEDEQTYSIGNNTTIPTIYGKRGVGSLTNARGETANFPGRRLSDSECQITYGGVGEVTTIRVVAEDGSKTKTYKIRFVKELSKNANLADASVNGNLIPNFSGSKYTYDIALPYGTTTAPVLTCNTADDVTSCTITQATSPTGTATVVVVAANPSVSRTYTFNFSVAQLADNTLQNILVDGEPLAGFYPTITSYKMSLPLETTTCPVVTPVSQYPDGAQTVQHTAPAAGWIDAKKGQYVLAVTTPGNTVPKKYTINFVIEESSNCQLADLSVKVNGEEQIFFLPNGTQYYVTLPMGTREIPEITYVPGDKYQTITVEDNGVNGTAKVYVRAANGDQTIYKITFSTETSTESRLSAIYLDGQLLEGFDKDQKTYAVALPIGTTQLPTITAEGLDEYVDINIQPGGLNGITRVTGTAGNGSYTLYQISFSVRQATDATLRNILVNGAALAGYDPEVLEYTINLPQGTTEKPVITWEAQDEWQTISLREPAGVEGDYKITVKPQSGSSRTYTLHVVVALSSNTLLSDVKIAGYPDFVFDANERNYSYNLPEGVATIPAVSFVKAEASQKVVMVTNDNVVTIRVVAEDGSAAAYVITFVVQKSENAYLRMIYMDGTPLEGFEPERLTGYTYTMTGDVCPTITVEKEEGQQVSILAPRADGVAQIVVKPEMGAANTYVINIARQVSADVYLQSILVDGAEIAGWQPDVFLYTVEYQGAQPEITYVKNAEQTVSEIRTADELTLVVRHQDAEAQYMIAFVEQRSADQLLGRILVDGVEIDGWSPMTKNYVISLPAGAADGLVSYEKGAETQQITYARVAEHTYRMHVLAENGATADYTVRFEVAKYEDPTLLGIQLDGVEVLPEFEDGVLNRVISKGAELPVLTYTKRNDQMSVALKTNAHQQQVIVRAENGAIETYIINYTERTETNPLLRDVKMFVGGNWVSIPGFESHTSEYAYDIPWLDIKSRATVAPCLWPISDRPNQQITIDYAPLGDTTRIHVLAEDGTTADYSVLFTVRQSSNTMLRSLSINFEEQDITQTDFTYDIAADLAELPIIEYEKAEAGQQLEVISASRYGVSKVIVHAENGDSRTYNIHFNILEPQGENKLRSIEYRYMLPNGEYTSDVISNPDGKMTISLPYGCFDFEVIGYEKNYAEQAVTMVKNGLRGATRLIVSANRSGAADVVYELEPVMPRFAENGKLSTITYRGEQIAHFAPDVYNYVITVSETPTEADFAAVAYEGAQVTISELDHKRKQVTFTVNDGETYSVCWYYETIDWLDMSGEWIQTANNVTFNNVSALGQETKTKMSPTGYKPSSYWKVPADYYGGLQYTIAGLPFVYYTGKEVVSAGANGVMISTQRGSSLNGSVPGIMTLGAMALDLKTNGKSTSSVQKSATQGQEFRNTPEQLAFRFKPLATTNITNWNLWMTISDGTNMATTSYSGDFANLNIWRDMAVNIDYTGVGVVNRFNMMLSSSDQENSNKFSGNTVYESSVVYENIHFVYNSSLRGVQIDGVDALQRGDTFYVELGHPIYYAPSLHFTGEVHDQMQVIEWLNDGAWVNGRKTARVTNYGENGVDHTIYYVQLRVDAGASLDIDVNTTYPIQTVDAEQHEYNIVYPNGVRQLTDIEFVATSEQQNILVVKQNRDYYLTVTNGLGNYCINTYHVVEAVSDVATLDNINGVEFAADQTDYVLAQLPAQVGFVKHSEGQTVDVQYAPDSIALVVTAEDGVNTLTYVLRREQVAPQTSGQIAELQIAGTDMPGFREDTYRYERESAEYVSFLLKDEEDAVEEFISNDSLYIRVAGTQTHEYDIVFPHAISSYAYLSAILVDGHQIADFDPSSEMPYTVLTDSVVDLMFVPAEEEQTLSISLRDTLDGYTSFVRVLAEDGVTSFGYQVIVLPRQSSVAQLSMILVDGTPLAGFHAEDADYSIVLPTTSPKQVEPLMPSLAFLTADPATKVTLEPAGVLGETSYIHLLSEDGTEEKTYTVSISAEPSHCADLTNIFINRQPIAGFKPIRTWYSTQVDDDDVVIEYSTDDRYQTISILPSNEPDNLNTIIHVVAQDGTSRDYELEIYREAASNNANLALIQLDGMNFEDYAALHHVSTLKPFDEKRYEYDIYLSDTKLLPDVSAVLQEADQQMRIEQRGDTCRIHVTAPDGESVNDYLLNFTFLRSDNKTLRMIYLDGDPLAGFMPSQTAYDIALPIGVKTLPGVLVDQAESSQRVADPVTVGNRTTIRVTAEDGTAQDYVLNFSFTLSEADTLLSITADGAQIDGFRPDSFYYYYQLPVGVRSIPLIEYEKAYRDQIVSLTEKQQGQSIMTQLVVVAENGFKNTYNVIYEMQRSTVDTLAMIYIGNQPMTGFSPRQTLYDIVLPEGTTEVPQVDFQAGDNYQSVVVEQAAMLPDVATLRVTAESGASRVYTISFRVSASTNASLQSIELGGTPLRNFDEEILEYNNVELPMGVTTVPNVTYVKGEEHQVVEVAIDGMDVTITVTALAGNQQQYLIHCVTRRSDNDKLADLKVEGYELDFSPSNNDYQIMLAYGTKTLPEVTAVAGDDEQQTRIVIDEEQRLVEVEVTPGDESSVNTYTIIFTMAKCPYNALTDIAIDGVTIAGFDPDTLTYRIVYPEGTPLDSLIQLEQITYTKQDETEQVNVSYADETTIVILVTAEDESLRAYTIEQDILLSDNSLLREITLDGVLIKGFDPEVTNYEYVLTEGALIPEIIAAAASDKAEVFVTLGEIGEDTRIYCVAEDGSETVYSITFRYATYNDGQKPTQNDVLFRHIAGSNQYLAATIRNNVSFNLYDQYGHLIMSETVPPCDPNAATVVVDLDGVEHLTEVSDPTAGLLITVDPGTIYFYGFYESEKNRLTSGKFVLGR